MLDSVHHAHQVGHVCLPSGEVVVVMVGILLQGISYEFFECRIAVIEGVVLDLHGLQDQFDRATALASRVQLLHLVVV